MAPTSGMSTAPARHDPDRVLAGYRAARTQEALFDAAAGHRRPATTSSSTTAGHVRPAWSELADAVGERGRAGLDQLRSIVSGLVDNDGITYIQIDQVTVDAVTNGHGPCHPARGGSTRCRC